MTKSIHVKALSELTDSINNFETEYLKHFPEDKMSDIWSVRDILCHVTYWHRYYAKNLTAEAEGKSYVLPKIQFYTLNQRGVEEMRPYSDNKLFAMLSKANNQIAKTILSGKVNEMTYRMDCKPYTITRFLEIVNRHIGAHTRGIMKKRKK